MAPGGILIYMSTRSPGTGGASIMAGQEVGLTSADTDLSFLPLNVQSGFPIPYRKTRIVEDVTTSQSADISKGNGFLAASIDGGFTIQDADGLIAADIEGGHINPIGWDVWIGYVPAGGTSFDIILLAQMKTVNLSIGEGVIRLTQKSPAYLGNQPLYGVRALSTLSTDPIDPSNPTDPTYLASGVASQFAGVGMGSIPVSLKAGAPIPVNKTAFYKATSLASGAINTSGTKADIVSTKSLFVHDSKNGSLAYAVGGAVDPDGYGQLVAYGYQSFAVFFCKDRDETVRLYNELKALDAAGYRIVISDGQWFLDVSALADSSTLFGTIPGTTYFMLDSVRISAFNYNAILGYPAGCGIAIMLDAVVKTAAGYVDSFIPFSGVSGSECEIFAVPSSIAVSANQSTLIGFAKNTTTVPPAGLLSYSNGITTFLPNCASSDGLVSAQALPAKLLFDPNQTGNHLGGIKEANDNFLVTLAGSGDIADISMDPLSPWSGGSAPVTFSGTVTGAAIAPGINVRLSLTPSLSVLEGDFICVEATWKATFTADSSGTTRNVVVAAGGPFKHIPSPLTGTVVSFSAGTVYTIQATANKTPKNPNWQAMYNSLDDMANSPTPMVACDGANPKIHSVSMDVMECFIFAYSKLGFGSIYSTIYPFWTQKTIRTLATDGAGLVLAGGAGFGTVSADGSIAWDVFDIAPNEYGTATIRGAAYGSGTWVEVGYRTLGAVFTDFYRYSTDRTNWTEALFSSPSGLVQRVRYVGGYFIALFSNGNWRHSTDGIAWTDHASITGDLLDVTYDGSRWHFVGAPSGGGGFAAYTSSITSPSFTSYGPGAGANGFQAVAVIGGLGNCVVVGSSSGRVYSCPLSSLSSGSWTYSTLGSNSFDDIAKNAIGVMVPSADGIWFSQDGTTWTRSSSCDHLSIGSNPALTNTQVGSENIWIVGTDFQIITAKSRSVLTWIPWGTRTPSEGLATLASRYFGGLAPLVYGGNYASVNPVQWTEPAFNRSAQSWGIAFDPPSDTTSRNSGTNVDMAARKIAAEWWAFAGEMNAVVLDGSNDAIEEGFPEIALGNIEDVATLITAQYAPFGGDYLKSAYIQNVDVDRATAGKPDEFFFKGWDTSGNTNGLAIWTACRNAYLKTQILRSTSLAFDSVHDEATLGIMWTTTDADLGQRIKWLCDRPQYLKITVCGNDSKAAIAQCGTRYKPNFAMLVARGLPTLGPTGYGVVVQADHNYTQGVHTLDIAFPPA